MLHWFYLDVHLHCVPQDISVPWGPLNHLLSQGLMEMFAPWVTSVLRVVGHLDPVLLAASSQRVELPLLLSATTAPLENTASVLEAHSLQVRYFTRFGLNTSSYGGETKWQLDSDVRPSLAYNKIESFNFCSLIVITSCVRSLFCWILLFWRCWYSHSPSQLLFVWLSLWDTGGLHNKNGCQPLEEQFVLLQ